MLCMRIWLWGYVSRDAETMREKRGQIFKKGHFCRDAHNEEDICKTSFLNLVSSCFFSPKLISGLGVFHRTIVLLLKLVSCTSTSDTECFKMMKAEAGIKSKRGSYPSCLSVPASLYVRLLQYNMVM